MTDYRRRIELIEWKKSIIKTIKYEIDTGFIEML